MALGFLHRDPVPGLRKKYDRAREKADKLKDRNRKLQILRMLDQLEPTLIALEEQDQPKFERRRMASYVRDGIGHVQDILSEKK
ncbi:MAG: hypothetical protein HY514_02245 [Candidatus Aenigmarchaeota archaeon]|nr:hypothetical protein [Candidatus Aenigmarchaeota archaeon]